MKINGCTSLSFSTEFYTPVSQIYVLDSTGEDGQGGWGTVMLRCIHNDTSLNWLATLFNLTDYALLVHMVLYQ